LKLVATGAKDISLLGGTLVPRLPEMKTVDLAMIARGSALITSVEPVYHVRGQTVIPSGTVTVRFRFDGPPPDRLLFALTQDFDMKEVAKPKFAAGTVRFRPSGSDADVFSICNEISTRPYVKWAEPDLVYELPEIKRDGAARLSPPAAIQATGFSSLPSRMPNDPFFDVQWHLGNHRAGIYAPAAWSISLGSEDFIVAVLDNGVDLQHEDLRDKLVAGYDFVEDDDQPQPGAKDAHGTACAGLIGAAADNGLGMVGVAWNCKIMPVRISAELFVSNDRIAEGIAFSCRNGAKILSCSWSGGFPSNLLLDAIDQVTDAGCLVFAAAGNKREREPVHFVHFPAAHDRCVAVGAVRVDEQRCSYSCYGPSLDFVAPSGDEGFVAIYTTDHSGKNGDNPGETDEGWGDGNYTAFNGTSASTPIVAGVAALVWSAYPQLSAAQVRRILEETATKIDPENGQWRDGHSVFYGYGKINAYAAMQRAGEMASSSP
jgi:subtilisin family serine protease